MIETLNNNSFTYLPDIIKLDLFDNEITLIEDGTFKPLDNLTELNLGSNHIESLPAGLLHSNQFLSVFKLNLNYLSSVPKDALPRSENMKSFELTFNNILSIKSHDFEPFQNCSGITIDIAYSKIKYLQTNTFAVLRNIATLDLDGSYMHEFNISSILGNNEINTLILTFCRIKRIIPLNQSFQHPHGSPKIHLINLFWNELISFPDFVFWGLNQTNILKLRYNRITTLSNSTFCGLDQLTELDISNNDLTALPQGMFYCNKLLQKLRLAQNNIARWSGNTVSNLCSLKYLNLFDNNIKHVDNTTQILHSLEHLDLSFNVLSRIDDYFLSSYTYLKTLNVSNNDIFWISSYAFLNLTNLKVLNLKNDRIELDILNQPFQIMGALRILDLTSAIKIIRLESKPFTGTSLLERMFMRKNNLQSKDLFDNSTSQSLFTGLQSLLTLDLRENDLDMLAPGTFNPINRLEILLLSHSSIKVLIPSVFYSLPSLKILDLSDNDITLISGDTFLSQSQLHVLKIDNNKLYSIPRTLFNRTRSLHKLNMENNKISTIETGTRFPTNITLDVSGNPFACTCDLSWFVKWLHSSNVELSHPNNTLCSPSSIKDLFKSSLLSFDPDKYCGINILLITSVSFTVLLVAALSLVAYWKRWWLNYKVFLVKLAICGYKEMVQDFEDQDYEFQLNLMYQEEDQEWVDDIMKPVLRERFPHIERVVFGDNDLHLGMFYINALHYAVENSFKTVLLLSNNSVREAWFITKVRIALEELNDSNLDKVILFFLEDIDDDDLPYLVRLFLSKNKPYMLWTDDEDGQELFWAQFEKSMRANRELNSVIPV
ncbi:toll-like receptor 3 [Lytechinus pictus]|uniref:toll-like receptor 3 n=1 Tax=Lytechinus pictus TaxID=7653 RepID=UPI0030B9ED57